MASHRRVPRLRPAIDDRASAVHRKRAMHGHDGRAAQDWTGDADLLAWDGGWSGWTPELDEGDGGADAAPPRRQGPGRSSDQGPGHPSQQDRPGLPSGFLDSWMSGLDPLLQAWLHASLSREARERMEDHGASLFEATLEVLIEACADAHGVSIAELRTLVPTVDAECRAYVLAASGAWAPRRSMRRSDGLAG